MVREKTVMARFDGNKNANESGTRKRKEKKNRMFSLCKNFHTLIRLHLRLHFLFR